MNVKSALLTLTAALTLALLIGLAPRVHAQDAAQSPATGDTPTYAILPFDTNWFAANYPVAWWNQFQPTFVNGVASMLTTEMIHSGLRVLDREKLDTVLKEQGLQASGTVDPAAAVKLGKLAGAKFIITGSITDWKMYTSNIDVIVGSVKKTTARCNIDYRIINVETGDVTAADTAKGQDQKSGFTFGSDWFQSITGQNNKWQESQIGKATRNAVKDIVAKMLGRKADEIPIEAMPDADHVVIEIDETLKLHKGDKVEIFQITDIVRGRRGNVLTKKTLVLGHGEVEDVQENGAVIRITDRVSGAGEIKEGCLVRRRR